MRTEMRAVVKGCRMPAVAQRLPRSRLGRCRTSLNEGNCGWFRQGVAACSAYGIWRGLCGRWALHARNILFGAAIGKTCYAEFVWLGGARAGRVGRSFGFTQALNKVVLWPAANAGIHGACCIGDCHGLVSWFGGGATRPGATLEGLDDDQGSAAARTGLCQLRQAWRLIVLFGGRLGLVLWWRHIEQFTRPGRRLSARLPLANSPPDQVRAGS